MWKSPLEVNFIQKFCFILKSSYFLVLSAWAYSSRMIENELLTSYQLNFKPLSEGVLLIPCVLKKTEYFSYARSCENVAL